MDIEEEESERVLQELENVVMASQASGGTSAFITNALLKFARIQMAISRRAHNQTRHVIALTWAIVFLTVVLLSFTIYLSYDAYLKSRNQEPARVEVGRYQIQQGTVALVNGSEATREFLVDTSTGQAWHLGVGHGGLPAWQPVERFSK